MCLSRWQDSAPRYKVYDYRVPIEIGQTRIEPGDILFGDIDGVCVIPARAEIEVFSLALEKARGEKLVKTGDGKTLPCAACHGATLQGLADFPNIAGQHPIAIARQLFAFKVGDRAGALAVLMKPVVEKLSEDDIIAIAAYVGSLDPSSRKAAAAPDAR